MANIKALRQPMFIPTTGILAGTSFKIMNSSGSGNVKICFVSLTWTSDNVSHVLFNGQCVVAEDTGMKHASTKMEMCKRVSAAHYW